MCFATLSMFAAALVEYYRQDNCINNFDKSNLSIYWQLPQNILIGLSEIFAVLPSFEYAYFASPRSGQTLFMSLRFCSMGASSFLGYGYMATVAAPSNSLNFSVRINIDRCLYSLFFNLVFTKTKPTMGILYIFLGSCRNSIDFYIHFHCLSKEISNHQIQSTTY